MKNLQHKKITVLACLMTICSLAVMISSCKPSEKITAKSGVQLWAENCQRCHNTPSPSTFSHDQWETVGLHMQSRALLTNVERDKIVAFLRQ